MYFCNILGDLAKCLCDKSKICFKDVHSKTNLTERTALHFAARYDKYYCVNLLVEAGANIEAEDSDGRTPLALAAWKSNCKSIKMLINANAKKRTVKEKHLKNIVRCLLGIKKSYVD